MRSSRRSWRLGKTGPRGAADIIQVAANAVDGQFDSDDQFGIDPGDQFLSGSSIEIDLNFGKNDFVTEARRQ